MKSKIKRKITFKDRQIWSFFKMLKKMAWDLFEIPKAFRKPPEPYCHTVDSIEWFKRANKPLFENECYITIESED